ncbi:Enoyl-[acyl-carrier-protein] reductase [NADH] FabI [Phytophthora ramorum]|uniref:Enoyl-[acyl-carrier-protein] reductase [NADH] FabI n=1 Tax=Phytophthora ramorum TaxID=164328 RepID=UPI0030979AB1|nr:Enoyl-[acyl-carrier-protein] reductase [NADH] FabI [Phytophthora ramorum]
MLLQGKRALVVGLMNKHSLAAGITQALLSGGANVVVSSKSPLSESHIRSCAFEIPETSDISRPSLHFEPCDVESDASIAQLMQRCGEIYNGGLDILVHSVAFAPREAFTNGLLDTPRAAWAQAMDVSAYSLVALARAAKPLMTSGGAEEERRDRSVLALTYAGSTKVVPNYNVMGPAKAALEATARQLAHELGPEGIRVNCLSPGPMNTVSARGIPGISKMRKYAENHAPLRRNSSSGDVGSVAAFLSSDLAAAVTGQTIYVDGGLSAMAPYTREE